MASTTYNPVSNGLAEAFYKTIIQLLKKFISASKQDWNGKLSEIVSPIGNTPFSLVYGCEIVLPLEIQIPFVLPW